MDRAELRYSLRSGEMFAGWVNHVYVVTDGQHPSWLRTDHPRLTLVEHRDIFTDPAALPVFNSHAIDSQLHHIPGLTERFVYLNDDVFFGRPSVLNCSSTPQPGQVLRVPGSARPGSAGSA